MNNKKLNKKLIIINAKMVYLFISRFIIMKYALELSEGITSSFCIILTIISIAFFGYSKIITNENTKKFTKLTIVSIIVYLLAIYSSGLVIGFLSNSYSLKPLTIISNIYNVVFFGITIELFRYVFINAKENYGKKGYIYVITFLITLLESNLYMNNYAFSTINSSFKFVTITFLPILIKNIMCSYLVEKTDYRVSILYRMIMDVDIYIIPIQPDLDDFFLSVTSIVLPYIILMYATRIVESKQITSIDSFIVKEKTLIKLSDIPYMILMVSFACVILGIGPFKLIGIETGSMTPKINIGDAVMINKLCDKESLKKGDIIAYENDEHTIIVHRIYKVNKDNTYITKGDYNNSADVKYVSNDQVKGKVMFKIPFIAYPKIFFKK